MCRIVRTTSALREAHGFSLIEMVVVILVLGFLVSIFVPRNEESIEQARFNATLNEMEAIARAIRGDVDRTTESGEATSFGYIGDIGALPSSLQDLVTNPGGYSTWRGPYLQSADDDYASDSWGVAYTLNGTSLVSSGSGSSITKQFANTVSELTSNSITGTVVDASHLPPGSVYADSVSLRLTIPNGSGGTSIINANPSASGAFSLGNVPIGRHLLHIIYTPTDDTLTEYVAVSPGMSSTINIHFPYSLW